MLVMGTDVMQEFPTLLGVPIVKSPPERGHGSRVSGVGTIWRIGTAPGVQPTHAYSSYAH